MFTFQPIDLLIALLAGAVLLVGLFYLALRRRNEILRDFLTPEEPHIEEEFFKKRPSVEPPPPSSSAAEDAPPSEETSPVDAAWGVPGGEAGK